MCPCVFYLLKLCTEFNLIKTRRLRKSPFFHQRKPPPVSAHASPFTQCYTLAQLATATPTSGRQVTTRRGAVPPRSLSYSGQVSLVRVRSVCPCVQEFAFLVCLEAASLHTKGALRSREGGGRKRTLPTIVGFAIRDPGRRVPSKQRRPPARLSSRCDSRRAVGLGKRCETRQG